MVAQEAGEAQQAAELKLWSLHSKRRPTGRAARCGSQAGGRRAPREYRAALRRRYRNRGRGRSVGLDVAGRPQRPGAGPARGLAFSEAARGTRLQIALQVLQGASSAPRSHGSHGKGLLSWDEIENRAAVFRPPRRVLFYKLYYTRTGRTTVRTDHPFTPPRRPGGRCGLRMRDHCVFIILLY